MTEFMRHVNAAWGVLGIWLLIMTGWYCWVQWKNDEWHLLRTQGAKAVFVFFLFDTILRWRIFIYLLPGSDTGITLDLPLATMGATIGMVCLCRVFSPDSWGAWRWRAPVIAVVGALIISELIA